MDKIKVAIIGFGNIAKVHALGIYAANLKLNLPFEIALTHVVTSRPESFNLSGVKICGSIDELQGEDIDFFDICSVNEKHAEAIEELSSFAKAIYCEKPVTESAQKTLEMSKLVSKNKIITGVPFIFRYIPAVHLLKDELKKETLGKIIEFRLPYYHKSYLSESKRKLWRTKASSGGGAILDLGVHSFDLIRFIFGEPSKVFHERKIHFPNVEVDEITKTSVKMKNGISGISEVSRVFAQHEQSHFLEIFCEKGSYLCNFSKPYDLTINTFGKGTFIRKVTENDDFMRFFVPESATMNFHSDAHLSCISDFARKVYDGSDSGFSADFNEAYLSQCMTEDGIE